MERDMKIRPTKDRCLVLRDETPGEVGGIIIPEAYRKTLGTGTVIDTGPGRINDNGHRVPMQVKPMDRIALSFHAGSEVAYDDGSLCGTEAFLVSEKDIIAVME
jgi:chaperonin GroES